MHPGMRARVGGRAFINPTHDAGSQRFNMDLW